MPPPLPAVSEDGILNRSRRHSQKNGGQKRPSKTSRRCHRPALMRDGTIVAFSTCNRTGRSSTGGGVSMRRICVRLRRRIARALQHGYHHVMDVLANTVQTSHRRLAQLIQDKRAIIGVIGLGYVGLPLIRAFVAAGFRCMGFDVDQTKVDRLLRRRKLHRAHRSRRLDRRLHSRQSSSSRRPTWAAWRRPTASSSACRRR